MKKIIIFCFSIMLIVAFYLPALVTAQAPAAAVDCNTDTTNNEACRATGLLKSAAGAGGAGYKDTTTVSSLVGTIIKTFLTLLGVIFLVLTVYAGYLWMTARGEEQKVKEAQDTLKNGIIGLALSLAAYAITNYVVTQLVTTTTTS